MMSYRKITINKKTYEYVVGQRYLKIKGIGVLIIKDYKNGLAVNKITPSKIKLIIDFYEKYGVLAL